MTSTRLSVAIVGCGRIAGSADGPRVEGPVTTHAQAYARDGRFSLDAICEPDPDRRRVFQEVWGVPRAYAGLDELLGAERPAVVSVCSSTAQHYGQIETLLGAPGVAVVFAEKPVCTTEAEMQALRRAASAPGAARLVVNHTRRFDRAHQAAAARIGSGALGRLIGGRCDYYGGWLHNGTHLVDTLRMLVGEVAVEHASPGAEGRPGDRCLDVRLTAAGAPIDLFGFDERHYQLFEIDLRFTQGRIALRDFGAEIAVEEVATNAIAERFLAPAADTPWRGLQSPLAPAIGAIGDVVCGGHAESAAMLDRAGLAEAAATMGVLWQALKRV